MIEVYLLKKYTVPTNGAIQNGHNIITYIINTIISNVCPYNV